MSTPTEAQPVLFDRIEEGDQVRATVIDFVFGTKSSGYLLLSRAPLVLEADARGFTLMFQSLYPSSGAAVETIIDYEHQSRAAPDSITVGDTDTRIAIVADSVFIRIRDQQPMTPSGYPLERYWAALDAEYPSNIGVIGLSPVGFSSAGDEALAMLVYGCGIECGFDAFFVLARTGTQWKVRDYRVLSGTPETRTGKLAFPRIVDPPSREQW